MSLSRNRFSEIVFRGYATYLLLTQVRREHSITCFFFLMIIGSDNINRILARCMSWLIGFILAKTNWEEREANVRITK